jgi:hypothetical protein
LKEADASGIRLEAREQEDRQHVWQYLVAAMLLTLVAEGVVASRTT